MQHDHSGGVLTGLIFCTLFLLAIGSLSWAPRMRIAEGARMPAPTTTTASGTDIAGGYKLASESSAPVKLAPRRSFAHGGAAGSEVRRKLWPRPSLFAARRPAQPRT